MKRFVSYLYSIYNNQKIHNAGFARVELRAGRNRIDIHLRENGYAGKTGTVYLFIKRQENIQGISIGNITFRGQQADFRYEQPEETIGQTSLRLMQMQGILIRIDGQPAFLSQWDEQPADTSRFEEWKEKQPDAVLPESSDSVSEGSVAVETDSTFEGSATVENSDSVSADIETTETGSHVSKDSVTVDIGSTSEDIKTIESSDSACKDMEASETGSVTSGNIETFENNDGTSPDIRTAELQPQILPRIPQWEQTWRKMLRTYPVVDRFEEKKNVLCVRIEIKDVRLLPEKYWSMVNNSFLLHGFFNYRYLIFGRLEQSWFVGIPGIYQNQEHVTASIFGFPDFLPQAQKNERGEQPGYWYRVLDI